MKQFVVATNLTTAQQDQAFYRILSERFGHMGWWHQVSQTWLLVDNTDTVTPTSLRDAATEAFPGVPMVVLQVVSVKGSWAGFGPLRGTPGDMFTWIDETWDSWQSK